MTLLVRTTGAPAALAPAVLESVRGQEPDLFVTPATSREYVDRAFSHEWMAATLTAAFGLLSLLLAVIGLYAVMAHAASQRVHEMGVRMALGARRSAIMTLLLRESLTVAAAGVIAGLAAALISTRLLTSLLHDVNPRDPAAFGAAVLVTMVAALGAGALPARRAASVDPLTALRRE